MFHSFLSWRYLLARRTNLIGISGMTVAVFALVVILAIMSGFMEELRRAVRGTLADVIVMPDPPPAASVASRGRAPERRDRSPEGVGIPGPLLEELRADPRVASATAQILWGGVITRVGGRDAATLALPNGGNPQAVQLVGVDVASAERLLWPAWQLGLSLAGALLPARTHQDELTTTEFLPSLTGTLRGAPAAPVVRPLFPFLQPPAYRPTGRPLSSVIVGDQLLQRLGLAVGDELEVGTIVQDELTGEWPVNNRSFVVAGSVRSGENEADLGRLYFARAELADLLGDSRRFTQVLVDLHDFEADAAALRGDLRAELPALGLIAHGRDSQVRTWEDFRVHILGAIQNERNLMAIMLSLVLLVAGFTVFAILTMMVSEKRRDIGILRALGATPRGVLDMFLLIAFWDALLGILAGALLGFWAAARINEIEEALSRFLGVSIINHEVYYLDHIPARVELGTVLAIAGGAFLCAILSAAVPAWRAARLDPMDGIRYE